MCSEDIRFGFPYILETLIIFDESFSQHGQVNVQSEYMNMICDNFQKSVVAFRFVI